MILFTPAISLLMSFIFSCLVFIGIRKSLVYELNRCIKPITTIQSKHRTITKRLLSLNPKAKALRFARNKAEKAYRLAPPHYKPAAYAALIAIKSSQKILRGYQLSLITQASMHSLRSINHFVKNGFIPLKASLDLQVQKTYSKSDSPGYKLKDRYQKEKEILFFKSFSVLKFLPRTLVKFLSVDVANKNFKCGATILEKEGQPWRIKLILDR